MRNWVINLTNLPQNTFIYCVIILDYSIKWGRNFHPYTSFFYSYKCWIFFPQKQKKFKSSKRRCKFVRFNRLTESPEAMVSFKKCGKQLLWKWKVRGSRCDLCADQAGRGGPVYFCWLDCHRGQQLLPLDTGPPCSERDLTECIHALHTGWLYSPDRKKGHQLVKSLLTVPFV